MSSDSGLSIKMGISTIVDGGMAKWLSGSAYWHQYLHLEDLVYANYSLLEQDESFMRK